VVAYVDGNDRIRRAVATEGNEYGGAGNTLTSIVGGSTLLPGPPDGPPHGYVWALVDGCRIPQAVTQGTQAHRGISQDSHGYRVEPSDRSPRVVDLHGGLVGGDAGVVGRRGTDN
jgi:hypothetical protein